jgi:ATP-dependent exoDNAse (exonuclease V) beta subunit
VIERIVAGFEIDRERDSTVMVPPPQPRPGLEARFEPAEIAVRVNLASLERAASLTAVRKEADRARDDGEGPAPLVSQRPPGVTRRPLSYTAISTHGEGPEERLVDSDRALREQGGDEQAEGDGGAVRGRAVHSLLEWSQANGWRAPSAELVRRIATSAEVGADSGLAEQELLGPFQAWLDSTFFAERIRDAASSRAEVPLLIEVADTVLRGSIDLLVEEEGAPPLIVDYKTDRLDGSDPTELVARYEIQQTIYALAVAEARGVEEVELAYVFLERPGEPVLMRWGREEIEASRKKLEAKIIRVTKAI